MTHHYLGVLFLLTLLTTEITSECLRVFDNENIVSVDKIAYLYFADNTEKVEGKPAIAGFLNTNWNLTNEWTSSYSVVFTTYLVTEEDPFGDIDVSHVYRETEQNGFQGVIMSVSDGKIPGEIMFFYYADNSPVTVYAFDIQIPDFEKILETFPNGAEFWIGVGDECDPYYNDWLSVYRSAAHYIGWGLHCCILSACLVFVLVTLIKRWTTIDTIFKVSLASDIISQFLMIFYGIMFLIQKEYRQGPIYLLFSYTNVGVQLLGYTFAMSAILLYICFWQLSMKNMKKIQQTNFSETLRTASIVLTIIMVILSTVGLLILFLADSVWVYYIGFGYFYLIMIFTNVLYVITVFSLGGVIKNVMKKKLQNLFYRFVVQCLFLVLATLISAAMLYVVNALPVFSSMVVNILLSLVGAMHAYNFMINRSTKSTTKDTESMKSQTKEKGTTNTSEDSS